VALTWHDVHAICEANHPQVGQVHHLSGAAAASPVCQVNSRGTGLSCMQGSPPQPCCIQEAGLQASDTAGQVMPK
jgi:hypothetical protein